MKVGLAFCLSSKAHALFWSEERGGVSPAFSLLTKAYAVFTRLLRSSSLQERACDFPPRESEGALSVAPLSCRSFQPCAFPHALHKSACCGLEGTTIASTGLLLLLVHATFSSGKRQGAPIPRSSTPALRHSGISPGRNHPGRNPPVLVLEY